MSKESSEHREGSLAFSSWDYNIGIALPPPPVIWGCLGTFVLSFSCEVFSFYTLPPRKLFSKLSPAAVCEVLCCLPGSLWEASSYLNAGQILFWSIAGTGQDRLFSRSPRLSVYYIRCVVQQGPVTWSGNPQL